MHTSSIYRIVIVILISALASPAFAQQTGTISGKVTAIDGSLLPGVTVEARSAVLPQARVTVSGSLGEYRMVALPPGAYTLTFVLSGMQTTTRAALVQLAVETGLDVTLGVQAVQESVTVTAGASLINRDSATIQSALSDAQIKFLPVGQEYRDLIKLIPGVQYTEDSVRGPSSGGNGQDNVYKFDGANVTLPLFGTLSAEPASHDVAQITTTKGGARAVDFDRAGGFSVETVSKSGTNELSGQLGFQFQTDGMAADLNSGSLSRFEQDRTWTDVSVGGPLVTNRAFFYGSYYSPSNSRENRANLYGDLPNFSSRRHEGFAKVTITPKPDVLLNLSYRDSHRLDESALFGSASSSSTGTGNEARLRIGTVEASWVISARSYLRFSYSHFANKTQGRPDNEANASISTSLGSRLPVDSLDTAGLLSVPSPIAGQTAYNSFIQPLVDRYGYLSGGQRTGGGLVGFGSTFDADDFFRDAGQVGYNIAFGSTVSHDVHVGYQLYSDSEDLTRSSNGFGSITVPGGRLSYQGTPIFYTATFQQQGFGTVPPTIHSEYRSQSIEFNDTIRWANWSVNLGVIASNDTLYGQGLREDSSTLSGYVLSPGTRYKMYDIPFSKMIQPRLGATWAYNGQDTVYASFARYNPSSSSLPRAASWDRNLARTIRAHYDASGALFAVEPVASSSGKLFVEDMTPRQINEVLIGSARQFTPRLSGRIYYRHRRGSHFWEDTNNTARVAFNPPATLNGVTIPREPYIADLDARRAQIGSGSSYVIAELDGAYTRYNEVTLESEWRNDRTFVRGSYTWSHYYGNFDQDNSTTGNDANIFIGSSFIADGAGRQLWDMRDGDLRGDRRHMFKVYGFYALDWNASIGAYVVAQSGQPWEKWSFEPYRALTSSTSDTSRFAEPAGTNRSEGHFQLDLNYTQDVPVGRYVVRITGDMFNIANSQTGYNIDPREHSATFGLPRAYFNPRRFQLAVRFIF